MKKLYENKTLYDILLWNKLIANIYLIYIFGTTNLMDPFLKDDFLSSALREWMVLRNRPQFTANTRIVGLKDNAAFFNISEEFKE